MFGSVASSDKRCQALTMDKYHREVTEPADPFDELVGAGLRDWRRRNHRSLEQFSTEAQWWGLNWGPGTVAAIERGKRPLQAKEFVLLIACVGGIEHLLSGPDPLARVQLTEDSSATLRTVRALLRRGPYDVLSIDAPVIKDVVGESNDWREDIRFAIQAEASTPEEASNREPERRLARVLKVEPMRLAEAAFRIWGHGLIEEREQRLASGEDGGDGNHARRGHVTRELRKELEDALGIGD